jgi:hypothetical protein
MTRRVAATDSSRSHCKVHELKPLCDCCSALVCGITCAVVIESSTSSDPIPDMSPSLTQTNCTTSGTSEDPEQQAQNCFNIRV